MLDFLRKIMKAKYEPLNIIEISANNLLANFSYLKNLKEGAEIIPVLKSNAYGHGLKEVAKILNSSDAKMVAVDSYPEAQIVYKYFKGKVLILGEMPCEAYKYAKLERTEFIVYREETLKALSIYGKKAKIHLFFNSGMNREGVDNLEEFIEKNYSYLNKVDFVGFCSHLASADDSNSLLNDKQEENFLKALEFIKTKGFNPKYIHLGNSAGVFSLKKDIYTAFRPGLAFYGYSPFSTKEIPELKPALELKTKILKVTKIKEGESVSYNEDFIAEKDANIALIPFGYFEGLDRRFSNKASFEVFINKPNKGEKNILAQNMNSESESFFAPVAGKVCMNLSCLDLNNNQAEAGNIVKIISSDKTSKNSLEKLSSLAGGIYETLVRLNCSIRRKIV